MRVKLTSFKIVYEEHNEIKYMHYTNVTPVVIKLVFTKQIVV
jgi:hypothetical protein